MSFGFGTLTDILPMRASLTYFGDPWPCGMCEEGTRAPTPVGVACQWCRVKIDKYDRGTFINGISQHPIHRECLLRQIAGSPRHIRQQCTCYGAAVDCQSADVTPSTPEGKRAEALESWKLSVELYKRPA